MVTGPDNGMAKLFEGALGLSEERLRKAISIETVGVLFFRLDGRILDANPALQRMSGYTAEELKSMDDWGRLTPPEFVEATRRAAADLAERGTTSPYEKQWFRKDGSRFWGLFSPKRLQASGAKSECVEFIIDITEQKRAEAIARESEARQSFLLKLGDALRTLADPVEIEATAARVLGEHLRADRVAYFEVRGADYFVERDYANGVPGLAGAYPVASFGPRLLEIYESGRTACSRAVATDAALSAEERAAYAAIQVGSHVSVPLLVNGKVAAGLAVHMRTPRDWTSSEIALAEETAERTWAALERARSEAALRASEERFRAFVTTSSDVVYRMNADWSELRHLVGKDFIADTTDPTRTWLDKYIHPEDQARVLAAIRAAIDGKRIFQLEHRVIRVDGTWGWTSSRAIPLLDADGEIVEWFGAASDVTERKRAEAALRESEARFRAAVSAVSSLIWTNNARGEMEGEQPGWGGFTGQGPEEYQGYGWARAVHPEDAQPTIDAWNRAVAEKRLFEFEHRLRRKDGEWRLCSIRAVPVFDEEGGIREWVGVHTDITEQRQTEEKLEKTVADRTAKLREIIAELEAFSYSIAHDMRAPLRSLQGFSDALLSDYADKLDAEGQSHLRRISRSAGRMDKLIQDILSYSRVVRGEWPLEPVDVEQLLRGIADTYPMLAPEKADIVIEGEFPPVLGSEAMLMQIFSNLLGNAVKFVPAGTKPRIRVWAEPGGGRVRLFVQDNGIGIPREEHEKIFGIFHQVGKNHEGTGIGLAIVRKAVERMSGKIGVESAPGRGTTFWIEVQRA